MGKRIISRRKGRGTTTYRANSHKSRGEIQHRIYDEKEKNSITFGIIKNIVHCPAHSAPIAQIKYENDAKDSLIPAPLGVRINDSLESGFNAQIKIGNTTVLKNIPEGTSIYNIENKPGDGGQFVRTAGSSAKIATQTGSTTLIKMPSKKTRIFNSLCRATIGIIAGSGKQDKPFVKAGKKHHYKRARGKLYPRTSGVAMNAVDHPFGSGRGRHIGKSKIAPRNAPPGRKVGLIRPRRTGKKR